MTVSEYANIEEQFKSETLNKCIDVDKQYGGQCWDLNQYYNIKYLGVPAYVLGGCGYVNRMLYPPKLNDLLTYFDEVDIHNMIKGDTVIWDWGGDLCHIAVFDNWDGQYCWFVTQNNPVEQLTTLSVLDTGNARAFRLKGVIPDPEPPKPEPTEYKVGDVVEINGVYVSSDSEEMLPPAVTIGTITNINEGARNPYLLDDGNIGWVNNNCIIGKVEETNNDDEELLDLVRKTIRGDFGNGEERVNALGDMYDAVQYQVEQNLANGNTQWNDIRLY